MLRVLLLGVFTLALSSCSLFSTKKSTGKMAGELRSMAVPDIPFPGDAKLDHTASLIMGGDDSWQGRIVYKTSKEVEYMRQMIMDKMSHMGWDRLSAVHSNVSSMVFKNGDRVATVSIESTIFAGSKVTIYVSNDKSGEYAPDKPKKPANNFWAPLKEASSPPIKVAPY